ncbi:exocyst complex component EXO70B1 [Henckelia pumila]|uniref:exocyst complex component EXO70B1 n=1 Tax=Henckelia pumila TaxID=405737 RepID=UPI003C6E7596
MAAATEGQDKVLATAQRIVQSLHNTSDTDDMLLILSSFDNRLSTLSSFVSSEDNTSTAVVDPRFAAVEHFILNEADSSFSDDYLTAVDEIIHLTEEINLNPRAADAGDDVMDRAESALQLAMARLEDEFRHILIRNTVALDTERLHRSSLSSSSAAIAIAATEFFNDEGNENIEDVSSGRYSHNGHGRGISFGGDDMSSLDLIHPDAVIDLREIADRMIRSGYEKECCQVYCSVRRDVLDECLAILGVEKLSIEEVQRMDWRSLDDKMRKWIPAVKLVVRGLLSGEKRLCDQIFTGSDLIKEVCFLETSKGCVMQFLNFGEAVAVGRRSAEKLFRILDMYDALAAVLPDLQALFMDEDAGDMVCSEAKGVLDALGEAAIGTFVEFENAVQGEASRRPMQNGEIHPLTRYVMNYTKLLVDYSDTLNSLLETVEDNSGFGKEKNDNLETSMSLIAQRLLALITSLESNLEEKSRIYEDGAMQYIFLMNNILYVVQKVKDSELRTALGDNWIKKRRGLIRQHATHYLRAAWTKVLSCLKDEGIGGSSSSAAKVALKERFKNFNICFEDIYRIQTAWKVPDPQLREELRISISEKVIPAYRSFLGRFGSQLESGRHAGKYIKYSPEDLENYLLDLFEGTPLILHHMRRKST